VNGTKVWTTGAHEHDWMIALVRTSVADDRHAGLSQVLIELHAPGIEVHPIPFLDGTSDFNEVVLTDVFVPDTDLVGSEGKGWTQVGQELAFERGGPDRWLSTYLVLEQYLREHDGAASDPAFVELLGSATARFWGLRNLSLAVARAIDSHGQPSVQAALVKEMGTRFEQDLLEAVRRLVPLEPDPASPSLFERLLANAILTAPAFTIRGGTIEILRSVAAKGLRS
jgi:alkylation response protein AidB-like acyl-CoA dehydrogenase